MPLQDITPDDQISCGDFNLHNQATRRVFGKQKFNPNILFEEQKTSNCVFCISDYQFKIGEAVKIISNTTAGIKADSNYKSVQNATFLGESPTEDSNKINIGVCTVNCNVNCNVMHFPVQTKGYCIVRATGEYTEDKQQYMTIDDDGKFRTDFYGKHKIIKKMQFTADEQDTVDYYLIDLNSDLKMQKKYLGRITGNTIDSGDIEDRKWSYYFEIMANPAEVTSPPIGTTDIFYAKNLLQFGNTDGAGMQGNGADFGSEPLSSNPNVKMRPIPNGALVELTIMTGYVYFSGYNATYGTCGDDV